MRWLLPFLLLPLCATYIIYPEETKNPCETAKKINGRIDVLLNETIGQMEKDLHEICYDVHFNDTCISEGNSSIFRLVGTVKRGFPHLYEGLCDMTAPMLSICDRTQRSVARLNDSIVQQSNSLKTLLKRKCDGDPSCEYKTDIGRELVDDAEMLLERYLSLFCDNETEYSLSDLGLTSDLTLPIERLSLQEARSNPCQEAKTINAGVIEHLNQTVANITKQIEEFCDTMDPYHKELCRNDGNSSLSFMKSTVEEQLPRLLQKLCGISTSVTGSFCEKTRIQVYLINDSILEDRIRLRDSLVGNCDSSWDPGCMTNADVGKVLADEVNTALNGYLSLFCPKFLGYIDDSVQVTPSPRCQAAQSINTELIGQLKKTVKNMTGQIEQICSNVKPFYQDVCRSDANSSLHMLESTIERKFPDMIQFICGITISLENSFCDSVKQHVSRINNTVARQSSALKHDLIQSCKLSKDPECLRKVDITNELVADVNEALKEYLWLFCQEAPYSGRRTQHTTEDYYTVMKKAWQRSPASAVRKLSFKWFQVGYYDMFS